MTWFNAVSIASGLTSRQLDVKYAGEGQVKQSKGKVQRPCIWDKYRRGTVGPSIKPNRDKTQSIVQRVEAEYPGTARWLALPLWDLLEADQVSMDDVYWVFDNLDEAVEELLVYEPQRQHDGVFWQKSLRNTEHLVSSLFSLNSLDAATALLGLIKEAEICQDQFLHQECYWALITLLETMQCEPPLKTILPVTCPDSSCHSFLENGLVFDGLAAQ